MKTIHTNLPLRVALLYTLFGGLWILISDRVLAALVTHPVLLTRFQTYKGEIFVLASAMLLYFQLLFELRKRQQTEEANRRHLAELEAVNRLSTALRTAQTLDEMLPSLLDETLAVLNAGAGAVLLYDPHRNTLNRSAAQGFFAYLEQDQLTPEQGIAGEVFRTGIPHLSPEFASDPATLASLRSEVPPGWGGACQPIRTVDEIVGVIFIAVQLPRQFTPQEAHLLGTLAEIAGNAIHRTRLYNQTRRRLQRISALHSIDQAISANLDLKTVLNILLEQVTIQLKVDAADVLLYNPAADQLEYRTSRGFFSTSAINTVLRPGEGLAGKVARNGELVRISNLAGMLDHLRRGPLLAQELFKSYFGIPLFARRGLVGVLEIFHRSTLEPDEEWFNFLKTLASQAAIAIDNATLFEDLQKTNLRLKRAYDTTLQGWSRALELRDQETEGHTQRVVKLTEKVARTLGLKEEDLLQIRRGTLLHDIGKMGIPDRILLKPDKLTSEEWEVMRQHPYFAYQLLAPINYLRPALDIPYYHHERWDGLGYPLGLEGQEIPLAARIFALVDVWDALRSDRPYRQAWPEEAVIAYIREQAGKQFDPHLAPLFLEIVSHMDGSNQNSA